MTHPVTGQMPDMPPLPPYIYGREAGPNERVWTDQAIRAYGLACYRAAAAAEPGALAVRILDSLDGAADLRGYGRTPMAWAEVDRAADILRKHVDAVERAAAQNPAP